MAEKKKSATEYFDPSLLDEVIPDKKDITVDIYGVKATFKTRFLTMIECLVLTNDAVLLRQITDTAKIADKPASEITKEEELTLTALEDALEVCVIKTCVTGKDDKAMTESQIKKLPKPARQELFNGIQGTEGGQKLLALFHERQGSTESEVSA